MIKSDNCYDYEHQNGLRRKKGESTAFQMGSVHHPFYRTACLAAVCKPDRSDRFRTSVFSFLAGAVDCADTADHICDLQI